MPSWLKFLIGVIGVALLTWLCLGPMGHGARVADDLESRVSAALTAEGAENIGVSVERDPVRRVIHLSGDVPEDVRRRMTEIALAQPGVFSVVWDGADAAPAPAAEEPAAPATAEAVASCQDQLATLVADEQIQFQVNSTAIDAASNGLLDRIAEVARGCTGTAIEISGHTDSSGTVEGNNALSQGRADSVRAALIERGVGEAMLTAVGRGSSQPLGGNPADPANRRTEFTVAAAGAAPAAGEGES